MFAFLGSQWDLTDRVQTHGVRPEEVVVSGNRRTEAEAGASTGRAAGEGDAAG